MSRRIENFTSVEHGGQTCSGVIYHAAEGKHCATVILMHGLGDSSDGMASLADLFYIDLPWVKFILPTATTRPVTMNMGHTMSAWYDIVGLDQRSNEHCDGIDVSVARIRKLLDEEHTTTGLPYSRMALAGFSQGAAMSLFTGLQLDEDKKLAGLLSLSGYLPATSKVAVPAAFADVPILHCHGTQDPVVPFSAAEMTKKFLSETGGILNYDLRPFSGGHTIGIEGVDHAQKFFHKILPYSASHTVLPADPRELGIKDLLKAIKSCGLQQKAVGLSEKKEFQNLLVQHYKLKFGDLFPDSADEVQTVFNV